MKQNFVTPYAVKEPEQRRHEEPTPPTAPPVPPSNRQRLQLPLPEINGLAIAKWAVVGLILYWWYYDIGPAAFSNEWWIILGGTFFAVLVACAIWNVLGENEDDED